MQSNLFSILCVTAALMFFITSCCINDTDCDGIPDDDDNCVSASNTLQEDGDCDCAGDVCDEYTDLTDANGNNLADGCEYRAPNCAGILDEVKGVRVLSLKGDHYEMGYAYGYLVAEDIMTLINDFLIPDLLGNSQYPIFTFEFISFWLPLIGSAFSDIPQKYWREVSGVYDGMVDRSEVDNNISLLLSTGSELTRQQAYIALFIAEFQAAACSAFSVWNTRTIDGKTIIGRNLDYGYPSTNKEIINNQFITSYEATGSTSGSEGSNRVVNIHLPGYIGFCTGISSEGIMVEVNAAGNTVNGLAPFLEPLIGKMPVAIGVRDFLETSNGSNVESQFKDYFDFSNPSNPNGHIPMAPYILLTSSSFDPENSPAPAISTEIDWASDTSNHRVVGWRVDSDNNDYLVATNYYREIADPINCWRYDMISEKIEEYTTGENRIDPDKAKEILKAVTYTGGQTFGTLYSVLFQPSQMKIHVAYAHYDGESVTTAPYAQWTEFDFDELFLMDDPNTGY